MPILFALSEAQLFELARCMGSATFKAGQLVFSKGDPGEHFRGTLPASAPVCCASKLYTLVGTSCRCSSHHGGRVSVWRSTAG